MLNYRVIWHVLGVFLCSLAGVLIIPVVFSLVSGDSDWSFFLMTSFFSTVCGVGLILSNKGYKEGKIGTREAFLLTFLSWVVCCFFSSLPFWFVHEGCGLVDALFESVSALTTTGQSVLCHIEYLPESLILWRTLIQWFGGIGIVVLAMTVFPMLKLGGMQLFRSEFSDRVEKILPRVSQIGAAIALVYASLTFLIFCALLIAGLPVFTAFCYAAAVISTGGMVNEELTGFENSTLILYILALGMILGASSLSLYVRVWQQKYESLWQSEQFRAFIKSLLLGTVVVSVFLFSQGEYGFLESIHHGFFSVVSFFSTTGFLFEDSISISPFLALFFMGGMIVGGCSGSTSGGIKIYRFQIFARIIVSHFHQIRRPRGVFVPRYEGQKISQELAISVLIIAALYIISACVTAILLCLCGVDLMSALSGAVAALSNTGTGFGEMIGNNSLIDLSVGAKWVLMSAMVLGRLEFVAVLVLFMPSFWKN